MDRKGEFRGLFFNQTIAFVLDHELNDEIKKVKSIGVEHFSIDKGLFATINFQIALEKHNKWKTKRDKINALEKPIVPEILEGHMWNGKIYGIKTQSIYLDGEKIEISNDQADELERYLTEKEEYRNKVREIKNDRI